MRYTSLNTTSFTALGGKITEAMSHILNTGESVRLKNRKGDHWLLVTINKDELGYKFAFIDTEGYDHRHNVQRAAIAKWDDNDGATYWRYMAESFELTEHPLVTAARANGQRIFQEAAKAHTEHLKSLGATHKVITYGGSVIGYGAYQRNWYGKKCLYLVTDKNGVEYDKAVKVSPEALLMIARLEALQ